MNEMMDTIPGKKEMYDNYVNEIRVMICRIVMNMLNGKCLYYG